LSPNTTLPRIAGQELGPRWAFMVEAGGVFLGMAVFGTVFLRACARQGGRGDEGRSFGLWQRHVFHLSSSCNSAFCLGPLTIAGLGRQGLTNRPMKARAVSATSRQPW